MEYIDELSFYFEPQDIALVERNLKTEKSNFYPSFQQIIQKDNMIEFELGLLNGHNLVELTLGTNTIEKTADDLKKVTTLLVAKKISI